jgi:hypothetical protein
MPILSIDVNQELDTAKCRGLAHKTTELLAGLLDKPKSSIMVKVSPDTHLMFNDDLAPALFVELKLFNISKELAVQYIKQFSQFFESELGIAQDRQYHRIIEM